MAAAVVDAEVGADAVSAVSDLIGMAAIAPRRAMVPWPQSL